MRHLILLIVLTFFWTGCAGSDDEAMMGTPEPDIGIRVADDPPLPVFDMGSENPDDPDDDDPADRPDMSVGCPQSACFVGATRCRAEDVQTCIEDLANPGCGVWDTPQECFSAQEVCIQGACQIPMGCTDNDGDQFGVNCTAGPDCDDDDPDRFPGNPEVCDGVDNDCDGAVDNGNVCSACTDDDNEPNDTLATAATLPLDSRIYGFTCANDPEFFSFPPLQDNREYRVALGAPQILSDLELVFYVDGAPFQTISDPGEDFEGFTFTALPQETYGVEVTNPGGAENFYSLSLIRTTTICPIEDGLAPNATPDEAAFLIRSWKVDATHCVGIPDFYRTSTVPAASMVRIEMVDERLSSGDLDLYLFEDPDGDGNFTLARRVTTSNSSEVLNYTVPADTPLLIEVRDFAGLGDLYTIEWDF